MRGLGDWWEEWRNQQLAFHPAVISPRDEILGRMSMFALGGPGIGGWLTASSGQIVFDRLGRIEKDPLSLAQFGQLLVLGHQAPPTEDFLRYYWLSIPAEHPYPIERFLEFRPDFSSDTIKSLDHLRQTAYSGGAMFGPATSRSAN